MEPSDRSRYDPRIDALRAIAFLLVAAVHFGVPVWTGPIDKGHRILFHGVWLDAIPLDLIKTGWIGVPIFLFVSGYSLALGKAHSGYALDKKQFFLNRFLRIFPVWVVCILMLTYSHHLSGSNVFTLLLLQTQDVPPSTAFNIVWSIQLEFMCYLLFPVLLAMVAEGRKAWTVYALLLMFRLGLHFLPLYDVFRLSYSTVFGGATIFLSGILTASLKPLRGNGIRHVHWIAGFVLVCAFSIFVTHKGGYQLAHGGEIRWVFVLMPEYLSLTVFLVLRGVLGGDRLAAGRRKSLLSTAQTAIFNVFVHIGKVSYSGYMFSLFVLDFTSRMFTFIKPGGWPPFAAAFTLYVAVLVLFASASYHAVELPFLRMRRRYDAGARAPVLASVAGAPLPTNPAVQVKRPVTIG